MINHVDSARIETLRVVAGPDDPAQRSLQKLPQVVARQRVADTLLLTAFLVVTFEKVHWNVAGKVALADIVTILFLVAFVLESRSRWPRPAAILVGFFVAFELV